MLRFDATDRKARYRALTVPTVAWLLLGSFVAGVFAQGKAFEFDSSLKRSQFDVAQMLADKQIPAGQEQLFDDYFNKYALLLLIQPENHKDLPKERKDLRVRYFSRGKSGPPHAQLNKLALDKMVQILASRNKSFDTAVKVNAMLLIGDLNEQEADGGKPARPYPRAMPILLVPFTRNSKIFTDPIRVAALVGLVRHAEAGNVAPAMRATFGKAMLDVVNQAEAPVTRTPDGHAWIRMLAAEALGALGDAGTDGAVALALARAMSNAEGQPYMRREMARALGRLRYPPGSKIDFAVLANEAGHLAGDVLRKEMTAAKDKHREAKKFGLTAPTDVPSLRYLRQYMIAAHTALAGPAGDGGLQAAAGKTPHKAAVDKIAGPVNDLNKTIEEADSVTADLITQLDEQLTALEGSLSPRLDAKSNLAEQKRKEAPAEEAERRVRADQNVPEKAPAQ